jgi:hypothetical protein
MDPSSRARMSCCHNSDNRVRFRKKRSMVGGWTATAEWVCADRRLD